MNGFIKRSLKIASIGVVAGVSLSLVASASMVAASAAKPVSNNHVTLTPLGLNGNDRLKVRVQKTKKAPKKIAVAFFKAGTDFTEDDFVFQTSSKHTYKGGVISDGLSRVETVVAYDPKTTEQLVFGEWTTRNWKSMKKSCNKTEPTIVVKSSYEPESVHLRVYKKTKKGKTKGKTIPMIHAGREGEESFYAPDEKKIRGWKAGKMVTKTEGFKSIKCL